VFGARRLVPAISQTWIRRRRYGAEPLGRRGYAEGFMEQSHWADLDTPKALWSKARGWRLVEQRETNRLPRVSAATPSRRYAESVAPFPSGNAFSVAGREGKGIFYPG